MTHEQDPDTTEDELHFQQRLLQRAADDEEAEYPYEDADVGQRLGIADGDDARSPFTQEELYVQPGHEPHRQPVERRAAATAAEALAAEATPLAIAAPRPDAAPAPTGPRTGARYDQAEPMEEAEWTTAGPAKHGVGKAGWMPLAEVIAARALLGPEDIGFYSQEAEPGRPGSPRKGGGNAEGGWDVSTSGGGGSGGDGASGWMDEDPSPFTQEEPYSQPGLPQCHGGNELTAAEATAPAPAATALARRAGASAGSRSTCSMGSEVRG